MEEKSAWEEDEEKEESRGQKGHSVSVGRPRNTVDTSIAQYTGGYILVGIILNKVQKMLTTDIVCFLE